MYEKLIWLEGKTLSTLDRHRHFTVLQVTRSAVIIRVHSTNRERVILMSGIEAAWNKLVSTGRITAVEILNQPNRSSAYISTMLSMLNGVSYSIRPIVLRYRQNM